MLRWPIDSNVLLPAIKTEPRKENLSFFSHMMASASKKHVNNDLAISTSNVSVADLTAWTLSNCPTQMKVKGKGPDSESRSHEQLSISYSYPPV